MTIRFKTLYSKQEIKEDIKSLTELLSTLTLVTECASESVFCYLESDFFSVAHSHFSGSQITNISYNPNKVKF